MSSRKLIFAIFTLILMLGLWIGCGKKEGLNPVPQTTGTAFIDTLYGSADTLQAGDTLLITARVVDEEGRLVGVISDSDILQAFELGEQRMHILD